VPVIPPGGGTPPTNTTTYVGAFWKASQKGERLIRIPVGTDAGNLGAWSAQVAWVDGRWNGLSDIVLDTNNSSDQGITWASGETPADMNVAANDDAYKVPATALQKVSGTVASGGTIAFRIGLKNHYTATDDYPARYALVVVTYGTPTNTFTLFLRQGEDPDYVWSPSENYPYSGSTPRTSAVRFSPYNLTAPDLTDAIQYSPVAVYGGVFTAYPTQAGAFFQWVNGTYRRYAYHPVKPVGTLSQWDVSTSPAYWDILSSSYETCPQSYSLTTGTPVNFRRPNDGSTSTESSGAIADSEMRQSLWEVPQSGQTISVIGSVWGFYADGFFDRRSHTHLAYGTNGSANTAVSILTKDVACIGRLFYNQDSNRSVFFPASGDRRYNLNGQLHYFGGNGFYWTTASETVQSGDLHSRYLIVSSNVAAVYPFYRSSGFAVRCVLPYPYP
jgi:hypothetical protein